MNVRIVFFSEEKMSLNFGVCCINSAITLSKMVTLTHWFWWSMILKCLSIFYCLSWCVCKSVPDCSGPVVSGRLFWRSSSSSYHEELPFNSSHKAQELPMSVLFRTTLLHKLVITQGSSKCFWGSERGEGSPHFQDDAGVLRDAVCTGHPDLSAMYTPALAPPCTHTWLASFLSPRGSA